MASMAVSDRKCVVLMYETASKRVYKSKLCVLFKTFRPSQPTLFIARRNWVHQALNNEHRFHFLVGLDNVRGTQRSDRAGNTCMYSFARQRR